MIRVTAATLSVVPLTMLMLSACVWQSDYDKLQAQNQQLQSQNQQLQAQVTGLQREASFVEAGDLLFPEGGYQLSPAGKAELSSNIVPKLTGLQNAKVVVYGYTDNLPVGAPLKRAGINDNLTLSSRRAGDVVTFLVSQGVNPNVISAKGFGETHPVAPNDTPADRAKTGASRSPCRGPEGPARDADARPGRRGRAARAPLPLAQFSRGKPGEIRKWQRSCPRPAKEAREGRLGLPLVGQRAAAAGAVGGESRG